MRTVCILPKSVKPGDVITVNVSSDSTILTAFTMKGLEEARKIAVGIQCFVEPPVPAQLRECEACGSFKMLSGEPFDFVVDKALFEGTKGILKLSFSDSKGWKEEAHIAVVDNEASAVQKKGKQREMGA